MAVLAVLGGYLGVALPMAATVRELSRRPGLRAQFTRGQQHVLVGASTAACAAGVTAWLLAVCPGLAVAHLAFWALVPSVLVVAAYRASSRPDLDYTVAPISTPFGDIPVDLLRQLLRGHLLVAVTIVLLQLA
jgi:hypothetical protein